MNFPRFHMTDDNLDVVRREPDLWNDEPDLSVFKRCEHQWDEFHVFEVVCSKCRECRAYTEEDVKNLNQLYVV